MSRPSGRHTKVTSGYEGRHAKPGTPGPAALIGTAAKVVPASLVASAAGSALALSGTASAATGAPAPGPSAPQAQDGTAVAKEGRIRLQFTSPTKPALITGSPRADDESDPDYRYLVVPLRALASG